MLRDLSLVMVGGISFDKTKERAADTDLIGTGDTTESVVDTEIGRIGQLNCWENMKYAHFSHPR